MSIKIHWGANGAYKTSGAVWDDVVPAIKEGRVVISNIRGLTEERCRKAFLGAPETFKLISVDMDSIDGIERCRTWFRWVPKGALIIFDETQLIFLTSWRDKFLESFDYPGGPEQAKVDDVPASWLDAWTRHRHWNWDIVLTTPNIRYVRADIRRTCEGAFKHVNFALLGPLARKLFGDYKEVFHDAQLNNPPPKSIGKMRRINKKVFDLYDSTATGKAQDTRAGTSIFASIPLLVGLLIIAVAGIYAYQNQDLRKLFGAKINQADKVDITAPVAESAPASAASGDVSGSGVAGVSGVKVDVMRQMLRDAALYLDGMFEVNGQKTYFFSGFDKEGHKLYTINSTELYFQGYFVRRASACLMYLDSADKSFSRIVHCVPAADTPPDSRTL